MLDACAPGWSRELKLHHWWVRYGPFTFRALPKGRGRGDDDAEVQAGKVRQTANGSSTPARKRVCKEAPRLGGRFGETRTNALKGSAFRSWARRRGDDLDEGYAGSLPARQDDELLGGLFGGQASAIGATEIRSSSVESELLRLPRFA